jgi:hypothetical protein
MTIEELDKCERPAELERTRALLMPFRDGLLEWLEGLETAGQIADVELGGFNTMGDNKHPECIEITFRAAGPSGPDVPKFSIALARELR